LLEKQLKSTFKTLSLVGLNATLMTSTSATNQYRISSLETLIFLTYNFGSVKHVFIKTFRYQVVTTRFNVIVPQSEPVIILI